MCHRRLDKDCYSERGTFKEGLPGETEHELANRNHGERGASKFGSLLHHRLAIIFYIHYAKLAYIAAILLAARKGCSVFAETFSYCTQAS